MRAFFRRCRSLQFYYLVISLVLLLALYPYVGRTGALLKVLTSVVLITGVYAVSNRRRQIAIALVLALPAFAAGWLFLITGLPLLDTVESAFTLAFYTFTTLVVLSRVLTSEEVTSDTISGAVSVYLLLGITWATAYDIVAAIHPGSFASAGILAYPDYLYFSFVTLATLGYGDITPLTDQTRSLAMLEAVTGVLYTAVLIARLVAARGWSPRQGRGQ
ncbi:two pore domain potassium channel family protein [Methanoculleus sp. FWC-SCC1]|uniref:Two pore domain potassium channel family protein n=2 Tax=Methanoculleus frigidifontis TaxID=2584085 RepID=A0ABT8M833_9EURY|nr:two pore domain potassium channel family protein [Methanoculleus sp. FWC-SCC1]